MLCRLCLTDSPNYLYIYGTDRHERDDKLDISEIIWKYIQIQIKAKDTISNTICRRCWQQLYDFHQFCLSIIEKQEVLQQQHQVPIEPDLNLDAQGKVEEEPYHYDGDIDIKNVPLYEPQPEDESLVKNERIPSPIQAPRSRRKSRKAKDDSNSETDFKEVLLTKTKLAETQPSASDPLSNENKPSTVTKKQKTANKKELKQRKRSKDGDALFEQQIDEKSSETKDRVFADCLFGASPETDNDDDDDFTWPMAIADTDKKKRKQQRKLKDESITDKKKKEDSLMPKKKKVPFESDLQLPPHMVYTDAEMDVIIAQHASLKCCICNETLLDFHHLKRHYRDEHQCEGYVTCCNKRFRGRTFYVDHLKTHADPNFISCLICKKPLANRNALRNHVAIFHPQEEQLKYECKKCSRKFAKDYMRRQHIKAYHPPDEDMKFKCKICGLKFARANLLRQHVNEKHKPAKGNKELTKPKSANVGTDCQPASLIPAGTSWSYNSTNVECSTPRFPVDNFNSSYTYA